MSKPHFLPVQESVILMWDLIAGYVILCGTGKHWRDSSVNISTFQRSEGLSRDILQLQSELSRIYSKLYYILSIHSILPGMRTPIGGVLLQCTRWFTLCLTLFMEWQGSDAHFLILNTYQTCVKKCGLRGS